MKTAIISGATSFIGCALIDECIKNGIKVIALVNPLSGRRDKIKQNDLLQVIECSLDDMSGLQVDKEDDAVFFHLAWMNTKDAIVRDDVHSQEKNIKYSLDAVDMAYRFGCQAFVGAGSQAEYGYVEDIIIEDTACAPVTAYGIAKLCSGQLTRLKCDKLGIRHIWTRILSTYGPDGYSHNVVNYTITELLHGRVPELSLCEQRWDFLYVSDTARALYLLGEKGRADEVYVIGSGEQKILRDYILKIRDAINPDAKIGFGMKKTGDIVNLSCDISKIKSHVGFTPEIDFEEGIAYMINHLKG